MRVKVSNYISQWLVDAGICQAFLVTGGGAMHLDDALGHQPGLFHSGGPYAGGERLKRTDSEHRDTKRAEPREAPPFLISLPKDQKRYFSFLTLLTSRSISSQASSPKVVPTTSITLPAVMAPIVPHWRSVSPSHSPARKPAA